MKDLKLISRGLVIDGEVYYKVENKSSLENDCDKCDLKIQCKDKFMNGLMILQACRSMYTIGHFEKQTSLLDINSVVLNQVEINFNNRNFVTKWDPRYEGCKSCIIYKLYVDPDVTGFNENCGRSVSCDLNISLNNKTIKVKDLCNPDNNEVYQFKQEIRF